MSLLLKTIISEYMNKYLSWIASLVFLTHASIALSGDLIPENQQKARILQYLIETVKWPANTIQNNEFDICLLGDFEDLAPFEHLDGKVINKYTVRVRKLPNYNNK